jgi:ketosteroid isomerase-like protein
MSHANVQIVRDGYEAFRARGEFAEQFVTPDFVWDMSKFRGWPEQQVYEGPEGARRFLTDWADAWEDWELEVEELHDAGEKVVAVVHQRGRSKTTGLPVDMCFAQVWTVRDGKEIRMEMYADPAEAIEAVGLQH